MYSSNVLKSNVCFYSDAAHLSVILEGESNLVSPKKVDLWLRFLFERRTVWENKTMIMLKKENLL